jgi:microcompartment protein CcmL/EutN
MGRHRVEIIVSGDAGEVSRAATACVKRLEKAGNIVEVATVATHDKRVKNSVESVLDSAESESE